MLGEDCFEILLTTAGGDQGCGDQGHTLKGGAKDLASAEYILSRAAPGHGVPPPGGIGGSNCYDESFQCSRRQSWVKAQGQAAAAPSLR